MQTPILVHRPTEKKVNKTKVILIIITLAVTNNHRGRKIQVGEV